MNTHGKIVKLICTGHISKALLAEARRRGDASFDTAFNFERYESDLPLLSDNLHYAKPTGILLKLKNVEPHTDALQMLLGPDETHAGSVFGLLSGRVTLQVGGEALRLKAGDWVYFDDQILHCVLADRKWVGVAIQCYTLKTSCITGEDNDSK
jgi:hypothetical protein